MNEIDFCIAPADASLSRAYSRISGAAKDEVKEKTIYLPSLTRALNNASNRAVRRILLSRSWPSAEALNLSLRQVAIAEAKREATMNSDHSEKLGEVSKAEAGESDESSPKCPVPRPILNVLTRKRNDGPGESSVKAPTPRGRTDEEYVADQLKSFELKYGSLPGYNYAEAYLESILSLATSGIESPRAKEVMEAGVYDDAYRRIESVLRTVGVSFEFDRDSGRRCIAKKLKEQDICLSMLDKINIRHEAKNPTISTAKESQKALEEVQETEEATQESEMVASDDEIEIVKDDDGVDIYKPNLKFWKKKNNSPDAKGVETNDSPLDDEDTAASKDLSPEDLGGVLLSAEEPTMTRQLNVLSNIVQRALLFGGEQELLVLCETLDADRSAFVDRWYAGTGGLDSNKALEKETRPGVQYLNCLISLLRTCYNNGIVTNLQPPYPVSQSFANAYERLVATSVELGSGYLKPSPAEDIREMPKPRTATEELGRFAMLEAQFRQQKYEASAYPEDLQGQWKVEDLIGGETIGVSTIALGEDGQVDLAAPLEGLRWRCDPGPTHLDTCTFQVLSSDGTILQYRGFVDRGARLEARVSKRPIKVRGNVMFQMRDGSIDYFKDMLPINYREGTTNFVMTKIVDGES